ncbi:hypothetical protein [Kitasatospora sp. NPDC094015]|uniref:hypothetical protein n=1 Tax=Kitasatospora sp. NPDC094015 TaxID=3155205 RepID=UPI00332FDF75
MPSSTRTGHRRLAGACGLVLAAAFALTGCDPSDGTSAPPPPVATSATAATPAPATTSADPTPSPTPTPTPSPTPTVAEAAVPVTPPAAPPAVTTTKAAAPRTTAPAPKTTTRTAEPPHTDPTTPAPAPAGCEIVSNAGNCYQAGQFCRNADLGRSTHDANGRMIYCRMVSGKPHWQA